MNFIIILFKRLRCYKNLAIEYLSKRHTALDVINLNSAKTEQKRIEQNRSKQACKLR